MGRSSYTLSIFQFLNLLLSLISILLLLLLLLFLKQRNQIINCINIYMYTQDKQKKQITMSYDLSNSRKLIPPRPQTKLSGTDSKNYPAPQLHSQASLSSLMEQASASLQKRRSNQVYNTQRNIDPSPPSHQYFRTTHDTQTLSTVMRPPSTLAYYGNPNTSAISSNNNNISLPDSYAYGGHHPGNMSSFGSSSGQGFYQPRQGVHNPSSVVYPQYANTAANNSNNNSSKANSCAELEIASDLLKVLRDQNKNLKEQNNYLLTKLRNFTDKEKNHREAVTRYEAIITELNLQNDQLKAQVAELTAIAKQKVDEFGDKLSLLLHDQEAKKPPSSSTLDLNRLLGHDMEPKVGDSSETTGQATNESELQQLNNQFEALLYSCRVQKDAETRKQIRRKLVELTYKMRQLRSGGSGNSTTNNSNLR